MKFFVDQNISPQTTKLLRSLKLDAVDVRDVNLLGADDNKIYDFAKREKRILVTFDHEFAYKYLSKKDLPGLIILRVHPQILETIHKVLKEFFGQIKEADLIGAITILEKGRARIRKVI